MKAVIVEIRGRSAAALLDDGCVKRINNRNYSVGQTIEFNQRSFSYSSFVARTAAAAAVFALVGIPAWAYMSPYSYVSLDVNPSIEYSINRFERVLDYKALNDDGEEILGQLELKNMNIESALKATIQEITQQGYLSPDEAGGIVIMTCCKNKTQSEKLCERLEKSVLDAAQEDELNVEIESDIIEPEQLEKAFAMKVSPGKIHLVEKLQESDPGEEIIMGSWVGKTVQEIMGEIKENKKAEKTSDKDQKAAETEDKENGNSSRGQSSSNSSDRSASENKGSGSSEEKSNSNSSSDDSGNNNPDQGADNSGSKKNKTLTEDAPSVESPYCSDASNHNESAGKTETETDGEIEEADDKGNGKSDKKGNSVDLSDDSDDDLSSEDQDTDDSE